MQKGAQDSLATRKLGTQGEFPAEIASWLMCKYLNQVHSFQKLASWMQNVLTLLDWQILMTRLWSSFLPRMQECKMKILMWITKSFYPTCGDMAMPWVMSWAVPWALP